MAAKERQRENFRFQYACEVIDSKNSVIVAAQQSNLRVKLLWTHQQCTFFSLLPCENRERGRKKRDPRVRVPRRIVNHLLAFGVRGADARRRQTVVGPLPHCWPPTASNPTRVTRRGRVAWNNLQRFSALFPGSALATPGFSSVPGGCALLGNRIPYVGGVCAFFTRRFSFFCLASAQLWTHPLQKFHSLK